MKWICLKSYHHRQGEINSFQWKNCSFQNQEAYTLKIKSNLNKIKINHDIIPFENYNLEKGNLDSSQKAFFWLLSFYDHITLFLKNLGDFAIFYRYTSCRVTFPWLCPLTGSHCSSQGGPCCIQDSFLLGPITSSFLLCSFYSCNYPPSLSHK